MATKDLSVVLAHGAWADGSSWARVIAKLTADNVGVCAAPLPLTSLADDVAALNRSIERMSGPVVLVGHAYAGAVIALARPERVKALVYITALAPDEGEKVSDVFYRAEPHPLAPKLAPDTNNLIWLPDDAFAKAFAPNASTEDRSVLAAVQRPISLACITVPAGRRSLRLERLARRRDESVLANEMFERIAAEVIAPNDIGSSPLLRRPQQPVLPGKRWSAARPRPPKASDTTAYSNSICRFFVQCIQISPSCPRCRMVRLLHRKNWRIITADN